MRETGIQTGGGRFRFQSKGSISRETVGTLAGRKTVPLRKPLKKNRICLRTPDDYYSYHPDDPRDVTSAYHRDNVGLYYPSTVPRKDAPGDRIFGPSRHDCSYYHKTRDTRKAMIIGERPSMYKMSEYSRPALPGNLFTDNLREQRIDWRAYDNVTWNDVLGSHVRDVQNQPRAIAQTRPQREAWLASIDNRVRYSKMNSPRGLPGISPRLFKSKVEPIKEPTQARYISKDRDGNLFYLVGPSEVTRKDHRPFILPEIVKPAESTQKYLDF